MKCLKIGYKNLSSLMFAMFGLFVVLLNITFVITRLMPSRYKGGIEFFKFFLLFQDLRSSEYYDFGKIMFVENSNIFFSFM